ncbi:conserved hypothetical protein [Leishmania major strain Friedlin]|uniref:Uncharacterized protein n=1 Tax=Leishmania major TaxID=5664 RepID=Q4QIZ2_LEIMA|nr:conserved hypothetical protein [Leishmania major strain Friedlin]CAG9568882.1 hypothetical_protein_-_conserved [Leishmania major strain Friedlin]CAJ02131.1 conserved hypothetical protein [Leishmania major strain Friedlin]|eukprot:XP_001680856.1 conserved hypothetical protein [Leishmania major strain Friedlin]
MATTVSMESALPESVMSAPVAMSSSSSSLTRLRTCLAIGCGVGLLLCAGVVLRHRLARPRPPPPCPCPMADNTIALLRDLHDGPFRFGDPTPFAVAARAEATRRIRRQQRERRRLRRRMRSQLCRARSSQQLPSWRAGATAAASAPVRNVLGAGGKQTFLRTAENAPAPQDPLRQGRDTPSNEPTSGEAATAAAKEREGRAMAEVLSEREGSLLPFANSVASLCAVDYDDDDPRDNDGYDEGAYSANGTLMARSGGFRKMASSEVSFISSTTTVSSSYDSDHSRSPSTSASSATASGSSYYSRISTPSLMQSTGSSVDSQGGASSLLAMTAGSVASPDGIPWVKATLDGGSVTWGGLHGSHDAPQPAQQHSQRHNHQPPPNDPAGSFSNIAQNMVCGSMSNPQSSSSPHSMPGAMAGQGGRYPAQPLWCGASSSAPSIRASGGMPWPGANTTSSWTFGGGGGGDSSGSPEVACAATFAFVPGPAPSLLASGRWGGGAEDEEPHRYTASALMYGPPLFSTEMDVTDALAELRSSVCCSGDRQGSSCLAGGASSAINTTSSPFVNCNVTGSGSGIMARINSSNNATSLHQQQLGMSLSSAHYRSQQQQSTHHHTWSHPRSQGYFSGTSMSAASASVALPAYARHTVHYPGGGSGSSSVQPPKHQHHHHHSSSGYHRVSSRTSVRRSANWSPAISQWLPETLSTVQPVYGYDSAPRGLGSGGSEGATGESTTSGGNGSFTHAPTETPISQASSALRRFMTTGGRAHHSSVHGDINSNAHRSFRSVNSALRHLCQYGRHCCSGRLRRCWRRCRRLVRRRVIVSCAAVQLWVTRILCAMRRGSSALGGGCARGWRWVIRQWRESASAASGKVLAWLRRPRWSLLKTGAMAADETSCTAAASVPSSEAAKRHPGHTSTGADTAAEAAAAEAKRGGLLMTDTADEAINKIVQLLEPTPGRVPTVVVIRAPLGYDVSTDAASLWKALHLDSTSSEEGLIDIIIMEELKTGPLPPAQARAAAAATGTSSQVVSFSANPAAPPMPPCTGTSDGERAAATAAPAKPPTSPLQRRRPPPEPSQASAVVAAAATTAARAQAQLRISFEIYPAHLFYSLIFRAAVLQEKDWALRRAAAELFGGSAEIEGSGKGLGASAGANASAGGGVSVTPGSPLSLVRALSFTFGVQAPAGDCGNNNNSMDPFSHHPHHGTAPVGGSATGLENYCLSPLSPGHFCRVPVSPKLTTPSLHVGISGGGGGAAAAAAGVGVANASPGMAGATVASPVTLPASAFSSVAATTSPQVVVRLSESYSFPAQPPQMVMSPPLGTQPGFKAPLGALPAGLRCSAYGGGGSAFSGVSPAGGASGTGVLPSSAAGRIISDNELLFYIHVLRTAVGDGVNTTALPSSRASEVDDDDADANSAGAKAAGAQRGGADPGKRNPRTPSGISDAALVSRDGRDAVEEDDDDSEDLTLLDLRQREIEPQVLLRYRFRVFQQGCRSRKALDAVVLYTQDHVEPWYEEAKAMLQALPATESCQPLSSFSTPSLRVNGSSPALPPSDSVGRMTSLSGGGEATTGVASGRPQRRSCPRPAGLPLLSLGTAALASTPELDRVDCRTTVENSGPLQLPAWAMEVLIRRESMRETLVRDLKEKAFRVCAVPLPDMRVHCILPPAVPRYVTAHARGFPLSRTFAEEVLSQQRALQFILLQREQENQRAIAARIRQEQRRQQRRDRRRRERRAREEASRRAQQERKQQKRSLNSQRRESGGGDSLKKCLTGTLNPATVVSRVVSMVKRASVGSAGRDFGDLFVRVPPRGSDSVRKTCTSADAAYRQESRAPAPLGEPDAPRTSPPLLPPPYRHGYPAASGGFYGASSPARRQSAAPEGSARAGVVLSHGESGRAGYGDAECRNTASAASPTVCSVRQHQRSTDEPSSSLQVYAVQPPRGLQGMHAPSTAAVTATSVQISPTLTEVDIHFLGGSSGSVSVEVSADASLTANAAGVSAPSCAADAAPRSSERGAGGDTGGSDRGRALASAGAPSPSATSPTPYTATAPMMLLAPPQPLSGSPPPQSQTCQGDHSGGGGSSNSPKPVSLASASSTRSAHWTAVHTATNANTCVTPPPPSSTASAAGSPAVHVSNSGSNGGGAANAVGHGHAQMTPASVSVALQNHFGSSPATTTTTSSSVSGANNTMPSFSSKGAAGFHSGTTSMSERGFPLMPLPPPPLLLPALSSSSPPALGAGTTSSSCMLSVPDASAATLVTTRDASLDVSAGDHGHHQDATVLSLPPQQLSNTSQPHRSVQNSASPAPDTSLLNAEGATHLTVSGGTAPKHMSSRNNHSLQLPDDGGVPAASLTPMPLAVPNNSMYGTFDAYYGHSVVTPQAVLLRQQAQVAATASVAPSSAIRALTSPRHRATANTAAPLPATVTLAAERDARKGELHNGGCAGDHDVRGPAGMLGSATSTPAAAGAAAAAAAAAGGNAQQLPPPPPHLQAPRSGPRRTSSGLLPYTYSADSVSSMYGTTHYPLYQYPDDPSGAAAAVHTGVSPPTLSMPGAAVMGGGSSATTTALAGSTHAGASGVHTYKSSGCSSSHVFGVSATGVTQVYTSPGNSAALLGIGGAGRPENWSSHSQSPRVPDSPVDVNASVIAPLSLPLAQDTHMNRLKQYNKLLSDLLGVAGGPMRSGISFYYTYGDATALLYNASIRAPCDENILELLDRQQWEKQQELRQLSRTDGGGGGAFSNSGGASDSSTSGGDKIPMHTSSGSYSMSSSATDNTGTWRVPVTLAGIGASPPAAPPPAPQLQATLHGSGSAAGEDANAAGQGVCNAREDSTAARAAAAAATEDEGCSYLEYGGLAGLQNTMDALESEQIEAQRARNTRFYSVFEHLHHAYHDTVLEAIGNGSAQSVGLSPVTAATATGSLYTGLTGGVGTEYFFPSAASAAGAAGAERHTASPHCVGHATAPGSVTPPPGLLCGGTGVADTVGLSRWRRRLWGRVCALVAWVGSLVGLARTPRADSAAAGVHVAGGATDSGVGMLWRLSQLAPDGAKFGFDPAKLAEYFPGERIVTFGDEWCIASRLDMHNGHFGLSPLQVWMATRYSRRFAGEVYLMDVIAAGGDPYYPAVRVLDEIVAHAVLYYHNHSLRDFVEDLEAELGLVYVPQTLWGRRALGLPDDDAEVQELEGLLYTATRRRQDRRRRQRAQEKYRQRRRCSDGAGGGFEKGRAATPRIPLPTTTGVSRSAAADGLRHTDGAPPPPPFPPLAADAAREGTRQGGPTAGSRLDRRRFNSPQAPPISSAATQGSVGGASDACPLLPSPVSNGDDLPSVAAIAATTPANLSPPLQPYHRPRRHANARLEDEEMAEYTWIQLQGKDQEEDEEVFYGATAAAAAGLGGGDINIAPHVYDAVMEREVYDERMLLRELDHLKEFLVDNRNVLSSAMLTTAGSNSLEAVFGVPATVFPFLLCARESVPFVASIFESLSYHYGPLTYDNFSKYAYDVYHRERPDVLRHTPRMFRMVNKSRRGCITYEELCRWMARKLSCGNNVQPNGHLLATSMSLRLPLALVAESRDEWDAYRCVLKSLSDGDDEEY